MRDLAQLTLDDFKPYVNQFFRIRLADHEPIDLELISVTPLPLATRPPAAVRQPFSIVLLGPPGNQYLQQGTYRLEHAEFGTLELFIVPLGPQAGRMQYEAILT
ncbi:MAG: hypothetical protein HY870_19590 [Chloroflexi bacterium]|nr:hypothetical protein [Chloroflexota bacterium]